MYLFIGTSLLSAESLSQSVAHFSPILRFTSVLTASATEEKATVSNSGRSRCLTVE